MTKLIWPIDYHHFLKKAVRIFLVLNSNQLSALFVLIGISIVVAGAFLAAFLWSVKRGQYDDDYTPSIRMLFDDVSSEKTTSASITSENLTHTK